MQSSRRVFVVSVAIALLMFAAWYALHTRPRPETPSIVGHPRAAPRPAAAADRGIVSAGENTRAEGRETVVCGVGPVRLEQNDRAAPFNYVARVTEAARSRWRQTLTNGDDNQQRAAGLLLQSTEWDYDSITGMPTRTHDAVLARDELVQLAAGLDNLQVYAMAVRACDQSYDPAPRDAACDRISPVKWAAMDRDNAAPWLEIAAAANARSDQAAEFEAVSHAAHAHRIDFGNDSLLAYAISGAPPETTVLERAAFSGRWIGHVGGDGQAHSFATSRY